MIKDSYLIYPKGIECNVLFYCYFLIREEENAC
jgi:hypothetical protein